MLTEQEKAKVRYHLGWGSLGRGVTFEAGYAAAQPYRRMLDRAFSELTAEGATIARELLERLRCLEQIKARNDQDLTIERVEAIRFRDMGGLVELNQRHLELVLALADLFQVAPNKDSERLRQLGYRGNCGSGGLIERV